MKPGKVYLIGAGPGDPGLITVKGQACIRTADVIIYDYLAAPALLAHASPQTEMIYVGKKGGDHTLPQGGAHQGPVGVAFRAGHPDHTVRRVFEHLDRLCVHRSAVCQDFGRSGDRSEEGQQDRHWWRSTCPSPNTTTRAHGFCVREQERSGLCSGFI